MSEPILFGIYNYSCCNVACWLLICILYIFLPDFTNSNSFTGNWFKYKIKFLLFGLKGTVRGILGDNLCKDGNVRFT